MGIFQYNHKGTVYTKTTTTNAAGQKYSTFTSAGTIVFQFQAPASQTTGGDRRVAPYTENIAYYELIVPSKYDSYITYSNRVGEIVDKYGNTISTDTFEIVSIQPKFDLAGKKHHVHVILKRIVETQ